jgi:hypothetical protein
MSHPRSLLITPTAHGAMLKFAKVVAPSAIAAGNWNAAAAMARRTTLDTGGENDAPPNGAEGAL